MNDSRERGIRAIACVLAAMVLVVLSAAMVNVALPTLAQRFAASPASVVRVVSAYQLGLVIALLPSAALGERFGLRAVFSAGLAWFSVGSALCALAPSLVWLGLARFSQGIGGAAVMALGVALIRASVEPSRLANAIAYNALAVALSSAAAPTVGALLLSTGSWTAMFALSAALGTAVFCAAMWLPRDRATGGAIDVVSVALNAAVFVAGFAFVELAGSSAVFAGAALCVCVASAWRLRDRERRKERPMLPLDLLANEAFRWTVFASIACFAGQSAALVALPFALRESVGGTVMGAALVLTPWPVSVAITAPIAARLSARWSSARLCAIGAGVLSIATGVLALGAGTMSAREAALAVAACGVGFGLFQVPNNRALLLSAPIERSAAAGATQASARLTGQWTGSIAMSLLFATQNAMDGARSGLVFSALATLLAALASARRSAIH
ncbi:MAG: MFS transporter [Polyangiales bacterium]